MMVDVAHVKKVAYVGKKMYVLLFMWAFVRRKITECCVADKRTRRIYYYYLEKTKHYVIIMFNVNVHVIKS